MEATPALRRSARKHPPPSSTKSLSGHRLPSRTTTPRTTKAKQSTLTAPTVGTPLAIPDFAPPQVSKTPMPLKSILKKSVHFTPTEMSTPVPMAVCDKENDCPSEDELFAATITPNPNRIFTPASKKSKIPSPIKSGNTNPRPALVKNSELKRKYTPDASPPKSRRKIIRLSDEKFEQTTLEKFAFTSSSMTNITSVTKKEREVIPPFTPRVTTTGIPTLNTRLGLNETPAKRPIKASKEMTPAVRAPVIEEDGNPFHPSARKAAVAAYNMAASAKKASSKDIFASADSFVSSNPSKDWGSTTQLKSASMSQSAAALATPARRPPVSNGLFSAAAAKVTSPSRIFAKSTMTCPPKRPAVPMSPSTPLGKKAPLAPKMSAIATPARRPDFGISIGTSKKEEPVAKLSTMATPARRPEFGVSVGTAKKEEVVKVSNLATPARRPDFSSFAKPTASSMARKTPTRISPLKEAPKRPHGLSPLKSTVSMSEVKEASSPTQSPSPIRKPIGLEFNSPLRKILFSRPGLIEDIEKPRQLPSKLNATQSARKLSSVPKATPIAPPKRLFKTEMKATIPLDLDELADRTRSPVNRKLSFTSTTSSPKRSPKKSDFDIFVDNPLAPPKKENKEEELVEDSITTAQVFAKSPPKTLGTRRESGIFVPSPDRSLSIGPFTQRLGGKQSPLRKEYETEIKQTSGNLLGTPTGNFFLDTMDAKDKVLRAPKYGHGKTFIVPLKGCEEEDEEMEDEEQEEVIVPPQPVKEEVKEEPVEKEPLKDVIVFLEVRTSDGADASSSFANDLKNLGAKIIKRWRLSTLGSAKNINPSGVNLVVFKDGIAATITKAKRVGVPCVGVSWVKECVAQNKKVAVDEYLVEQAGLAGINKKRRTSLVPKLHKCVNNPAKETKAKETKIKNTRNTHKINKATRYDGTEKKGPKPVAKNPEAL